MDLQVEKETERMKISRKNIWKFKQATENSKLTEMIRNEKKENLKNIYQ